MKLARRITNTKKVAGSLIYRTNVLDQEALNKKLFETIDNFGGRPEVSYWIMQGANIEARNSKKETPLFMAVYRGGPAIINLLLECGANIDAKDKWGRTPLMNAVMQSDRGTEAWLLIEKGADVHAKDKGGTPVICFAALYGRNQIVYDLLKKGADINATDRWGKTPLMIAVKENNLKLIAMLIEMGADITIMDNEGMTVLDQARRQENAEKFGTLQIIFLAGFGKETFTAFRKSFRECIVKERGYISASSYLL
jgi:ankyrin repeat protein